MVIHEPIVDELAERVRAEYLEMPGMALTKWQMRRMWVMSPHVCDAVIEELISTGFLRRRMGMDDTFVRANHDV